MDLVRAFRYVFDDKDWVEKIAVTGALALFSVALMPFLLLGLLPLCVLLGYMVDVVANVRDGQRTPLPQWNNYSEWLLTGGTVLIPILIYNLPLMLIGCCVFFAPGTFNDRIFGNLITLTSLCCIMPGLLLFVAVTWPMLAVGTAHYARSRNIGDFFQIGRLWLDVTDLGGISIQWLFCTLIISLGTLIPCIGWVVWLTLAFPAYGHLLGQYAAQVEALGPIEPPEQPKQQPAPKAPPRRPRPPAQPRPPRQRPPPPRR